MMKRPSENIWEEKILAARLQGISSHFPGGEGR
jgi:hypothetical protein